MAEVKEKHPTWFKMKIERRQLIKQLPAETAVSVLLACWDFLETGEIPETLTPIEKIAFSAFFPDMEEAWRRYEQRVNARSNPASTEIVRYRSISHDVEEERNQTIDYRRKEKRVYILSLLLSL